MDTIDRRSFLKTSGTLGAGAALAPWLGACSHLPPLSDAELRELSAAQAVAAIRDGRVSAEAYAKVLLARAEQVQDLNAMITLDMAGTLAAARRIDTMRSNGQAL